MIAPRSDAPHAHEHPIPRRVRETLERLLDGHSEKQIATSLAISPNTVHVYVKQIYRKYRVNSRAELLSLWIKQGGNHVRKNAPKSPLSDLARLVENRNEMVRQLQQLDQQIAAVRDKLSQLDEMRNCLLD